MELRPNLFLIGAMKSGTSSLYAYLGAHPQIFMSEPKEPSYFVDPAHLKKEWPDTAKQPFSHDRAAYLKLFEGATDFPVIGEASTNYTKLTKITGCAERIFAFNPKARFIYIMRDPITRTISHYWHKVKAGRETREILDAIRTEPHYREVSYYALQLRPYITCFGREQIEVLTFESLVCAPEQVMKGLFRWLGVRDDIIPKNLGERKNETPDRIARVRRRRLFYRFRRSHFWDVIGPYTPARLRRLGRNLTENEVQREQAPINDVVAYLRLLQIAETAELRALLGRDFPEWTTLYGTVDERGSEHRLEL